MSLALRSFSTLLLIVCFFAGSAQTDLSKPIPVESTVKIGKLPNGLTYYIRKNPKPEKKVELRLVVNAGSVLEENNQKGLAHFMEHMGFNGSKNFPKNELVDYLQKTGVKFGADLNAYTSFDETVYILPIPSDDPQTVEKGFTVLEDWAFNNLFDKTEVEKERGVVLEELRLSKGAQERMMRKYLPLLFNNSLYGDRLPIGTDTVLKSFSHETLQNFYRQWYRPDLMSVVVVGDIDPATAELMIVKHFGWAKNPTNAKARPSIISIPDRTSPDAIVVTDEEETSTAVQIMNFIRPSQRTVTMGDYRKQIVNNLVTTLINQRLQELTQSPSPPFVFAFSGMTPFLRGYEAFTSYAVLGEGKVEDAVNAMIGETERARQFGFLSAELDRAKASMLNQSEKSYKERDKQYSNMLVNKYVNHFLQNSPIPGEEDQYNFIKEVLPTITQAEVNAYVKSLPSTQDAVTILTAPAAVQSTLPSNEQLLSIIKTASEKPVTAYVENEVRSSLIDKNITAGKVIKESKNAKLGTTNYTLNNNVTITLKPTPYKNDQIVLDAWRWGGFHKATLADKNNAKYAATIVREMGVKDMSPSDLQKFLSGKTVGVSPYINNHEEGIEGSTSVKDFETFLQLIHLYFTEPRKNKDLFTSFLNKERSMIKFLKEDPMTYFMDTLTDVIYKNNPWRATTPDEKEYSSISLDKSFDIYKKVFGNANGMHFTFVGNIDEKTAKPLIEKYLGSLPSKPMEVTFKDNNLRPVKGKVNLNIEKGKEQQSFITLHFSGPADPSIKEKLALQGLIEILNIQVIEKLREDMSGMYGGGFNGSITNRPYPHFTLSANIPCGPENVDKLSAALMDIIKKSKTSISEKDLQKVKATWIKQYETGIQTNEFWLNNLSNSFINKTDPNNIVEYKKFVESLTIADIKKAAQKYLDLNNYVSAVLSPEDTKADRPKKTF